MTRKNRSALQKPHRTAPYPPDSGSRNRSMVIIDVDGVLFKGQFFLKLTRKKGLFRWIAAFLDAIMFNLGRIDLPRFLSKSYQRLKGAETRTLEDVFASIPRHKNVKQTVQALKEGGYHVMLLSSGVPDEYVQKLVSELGADRGKGIHVHAEENVLTGEISGILTTEKGKLQVVQEWIEELTLSWERTVVIGDDKNNLQIMEKAAVSIGFHATLNVRQRAMFLVETDDFSDVLPVITNPGKPVTTLDLPNEIRRKLIHLIAFVFPFVISHLPSFTLLLLYLLITVMVFYSISEYFRLNGIAMPGFGNIMQLTIRKAENRSFAAAPIALASGVVCCLFFRYPVPYIAIGVIAFGDSAAGLTGQFFGRHKLPYNRGKSCEGTAASFLVCLLLCTFFLPLPESAAVALFASLVESLPLGQWDNLIVPLATAFFCRCVLL